ncbi:hypothetical protein EOK75_01060 [Pseudorhodobacter turbinis]|uniref:Uncharacterized protein n=1 Tax=Pseudorhodobacter turbinis TaxID=2500533 RepID=A0A4P8ECZ9_9RHOB|nr:hypothetical protein [Pseudorhodobacter turbinis]QCO54533.1 hypothetical protein EOK75_01060 [Pseudorhodobacter turbinis]
MELLVLSLLGFSLASSLLLTDGGREGEGNRDEDEDEDEDSIPVDVNMFNLSETPSGLMSDFEEGIATDLDVNASNDIVGCIGTVEESSLSNEEDLITLDGNEGGIPSGNVDYSANDSKFFEDDDTNSLEFSRHLDNEEFILDIPETTKGFLHQIDVEVEYDYEAGGAASSEESTVNRQFSFYVLSGNEALPEPDISVKNIYDLRSHVDFGDLPFDDSRVVAALDLGGSRVSVFETVDDFRSTDSQEFLSIVTREFITDWSPNSVTINREVASVQHISIKFDGEVRDY